MKTPQQNRTNLLDDLLQEGDGGNLPAQSAVITLIRHEKSSRKRRRAVAGAAVCVGLIAVAAIWAPRLDRAPTEHGSLPGTGTAREVAEPTESQDIKIVRIDDEDLLALLENQPAALVRFSNGERRLLVVVQSHAQ